MIYIVIAIAPIIFLFVYFKIQGMQHTINLSTGAKNSLQIKNKELREELDALTKKLSEARETVADLKFKEISQEKWKAQQHTLFEDQKREIEREIAEKEKILKENDILQEKLSKTQETVADLEFKEISQENWEKQQKIILEEQKHAIAEKESMLIRRLKQFKEEQTRIKDDILFAIDENLSEKGKAYKWISGLIADIKIWIAESKRDTGELIKTKRTASSQARVDVLLNEKRQLEIENSMLKYHLEYIKTLIPEVDTIVEYNDFEYQKDDAYNPSRFLAKEEYSLLSDTEKNIRALEYYKQRKKSNWEIGRDFEMFIGYDLEKKGFNVIYFGIEKKLNDLGRDLIAKNSKKTYVIQCKYWSQEKEIHEKHLAQLYGTYIMYKLENPSEKNVDAVLVTHTTLSEVAKKFAKMLGIKTEENKELGEYPLIKCNVGKDENGLTTKIYHLPMDQQYDKIIIDRTEGDFMAFTVQEAEKKGFRRAFKWHGAI